MQNIPLALTYDDVLIVPKRSTLTSRREASTKTRLTKKINLNIPIVSANMDSVTGAAMAITMARLGGIGIVHRFMTIEENVEEIKKVKRAQNYIITDPYTIEPTKTVGEAKEFIETIGTSGLIVANGDHRLRGILSSRDLLLATSDYQLVGEVMTPREKLVVGNKDTTFAEAKKKMAENKVEKLPLVDDDNVVMGLITLTDIKHLNDYPNANVDSDGQLIVGGSVGVTGDYLERAQALVAAGVDALVLDIAHGHSDLMFNAISKVRAICGDIQIIAGNIATAGAARELCEAGVDAIKIGVGPGTICITRMVTGCGMPQLTAIMQCAEVAKQYGVPLIADGGIQRSGDIVKAIAAGADTMMAGSLFTGTTESPGSVMTRGGKKYKMYSGSASYLVSQHRKSAKLEKKDLSEVVPEGVESIVPFRGTVVDIVNQLVGGLKSGMSYTNSRTIAELQSNTEFVQISAAGWKESGAHDVGEIK